MAIIIETCPKCGCDLVDGVLASNPPIPKKECWSCGWSWTGEPEKVKRVPFGGNSFEFEKGNLFYPDNKYTLVGSTYDNELINSDCAKAFDNLAITVSNYYGNTISATEVMEAFTKTVEEYSNKLSANLEEYNDSLIRYDLIKDFEIKQSACENCSNNPKNGGSGICHCTLGQIQVTY